MENRIEYEYICLVVVFFIIIDLIKSDTIQLVFLIPKTLDQNKMSVQSYVSAVTDNCPYHSDYTKRIVMFLVKLLVGSQMSVVEQGKRFFERIGYSEDIAEHEVLTYLVANKVPSCNGRKRVFERYYETITPAVIERFHSLVLAMVDVSQSGVINTTQCAPLLTAEEHQRFVEYMEHHLLQYRIDILLLSLPVFDNAVAPAPNAATPSAAKRTTKRTRSAFLNVVADALTLDPVVPLKRSSRARNEVNYAAIVKKNDFVLRLA